MYHQSKSKSPESATIATMSPPLRRRWRIGFLFTVPLLFLLPHLLSVSELHQKATFGVKIREKASKPDHLVLGPAAGQGLPDRIQCQGIHSLNRAANSMAYSRTSKLSSKISFVTVFAFYRNPTLTGRRNVEPSRNVTLGNVSYDKIGRSMAILNTFINFIKVSMPSSGIFILTDPSFKLPLKSKSAIVQPIPGDYSRSSLMLQRIKSYIAFLESKYDEHMKKANDNHHYIFTDSDIAVIDDLGNIFQDYPQFHLALTFRNNKEQPLNSGFIAVRGTADGILNAKIFLEGVLKVYISRYMKASRMLGDQLALAWFVKSQQSFDATKFRKPLPFSSNINGAFVLFLPCAIYNWTPPEGAGQFHGMPLDVKIVHFKGSRKRLMLESWNFFNSTSNLSDMLCLVLSSGRTKYDF